MDMPDATMSDFVKGLKIDVIIISPLEGIKSYRIRSVMSWNRAEEREGKRAAHLPAGAHIPRYFVREQSRSCINDLAFWLIYITTPLYEWTFCWQYMIWQRYKVCC
jgi:hypothetical protein